jgi:hypothetical protein
MTTEQWLPWKTFQPMGVINIAISDGRATSLVERKIYVIEI